MVNHSFFVFALRLQRQNMLLSHFPSSSHRRQTPQFFKVGRSLTPHHFFCRIAAKVNHGARLQALLAYQWNKNIVISIYLPRPHKSSLPFLFLWPAVSGRRFNIPIHAMLQPEKSTERVASLNFHTSIHSFPPATHSCESQIWQTENQCLEWRSVASWLELHRDSSDVSTHLSKGMCACDLKSGNVLS